MLAYAANHPRAAGRAGSPKALALIIAAHALVLVGVLSAKSEIIEQLGRDKTTTFDVPVPPPPHPTDGKRVEPKKEITQDSFIPRERPIIDMDRQFPSIPLDQGPSLGDIGAVIGSGPTTIIDEPNHVPVKLGPRLATSEQALKPPYPLDKIRAEEEATLKLKLTIDARGRVTSVDPVGAADPSFLEAARKHILKSWRYKPATEDGVAVPTTTVISLSFRLEDV